ncbi:uncharacterized protein LOC117298999 isoform X1 [Asterias rubens]|uniref:uncharacterized protein LOC117298999 isoform X1 n=1 Tax=Asterias rubens TaxID=7604 RepID=UPI0014553007|nr:uncharacterized protein LOC117298999 isoform X1 [Asterias rubens]
MMKMDGMKWVAKNMLRRSDLATVVIDQKTVQELINGKLISSLNDVSLDLLKWSYSEPNYAFPDVFSAWSDLDAGFTQLLQEYMEECSRYRKTFKDITAEGKKVTEVQREKEKSASKVVACRNKVESAKKAKKTEKSKIVNLESELYLAQAKDGEMAEVLKKCLSEFEVFKAVLLKESMTKHCQSLMGFLEKSTALCKVKLEAVESMPSGPAMTPSSVSENSSKVEDVFRKLHLQLPPRDPALERNLPAQKFKSLPPPQTFNNSPQNCRLPLEPVFTQQGKNKQPKGGVPVFNRASESDESDLEDENEYMTPDEEMLKRKISGNEAPKLPPRNNEVEVQQIEEDEEDDMYVVPNLSPCLSSPGASKSEYFEVVSDTETPVMPPSFNSSANAAQCPPRIQVEQNEPQSDPVYFVPDDGQEDFDQLYGNVDNDEFKEHQRQSVAVSPTPQTKLRKPAVFPKPFQKAVKDPPPKSPKNSPPPVVIEDDDIYSCVYEEEKSGGSPPAPSARTTSPTDETSALKFEHSYVNLVCDTVPLHEPSFNEVPYDENEFEVRHTYFKLPNTKRPVPAHKPQSPQLRPVAAVRSSLK